jgi:hypothetical protein
MTSPQGFIFPDMFVGGSNISSFLSGTTLNIAVVFGAAILQPNSKVASIESSGVSTFVYYNLMSIVETDTAIELVYYGNITINATINTTKRLTVVSFNGSITIGPDAHITAADMIFICPEGRFSNSGSLTAAPGNLFISASAVNDIEWGTTSSKYILANQTFLIPDTTNAQTTASANEPLIITNGWFDDTTPVDYQIGETGTPSTVPGSGGPFMLDETILGYYELDPINNIMTFMYTGDIIFRSSPTFGGGHNQVAIRASGNVSFVSTTGEIGTLFNYTGSGDAGDIIIAQGGDLLIGGISTNISDGTNDAEGDAGNIFLIGGGNITSTGGWFTVAGDAEGTAGNAFVIGRNLMLYGLDNEALITCISQNTTTAVGGNGKCTAISGGPISIYNPSLSVRALISGATTLTLPSQQTPAALISCYNGNFFSNTVIAGTLGTTLQYGNNGKSFNALAKLFSYTYPLFTALPPQVSLRNISIATIVTWVVLFVTLVLATLGTVAFTFMMKAKPNATLPGKEEVEPANGIAQI